MKKMLFLMIVGATLAYFFDPVSGASRRRSLQQKMAKSPPIRPVGTVSDLSTSATSAPFAAAR